MTVLEHTYAPRGAAKALLYCRAAEVVLEGPAGTGKSRAALEKIHLMTLRNSGMRALIVRKTATSLTSSGLVTYRTQVANEALLGGLVEWYSGSAQEPAAYRYRNGSVIVVGGMDKATRIMSTEYDVIFVQEATELTEDDWEALTTRLRHGRVSFQQLIGDCNPSTPTHWLKVRIDSGRTKGFASRHEDNPKLFNDERSVTEYGAAYLSKLDALSGVRFLRLRKGQWVAAEGMIYEEFDSAVHLVDPFEIPADWPRYWTVDFGFTNPMVVQCWAEDPDGRLFLYREWYQTKRLVEQMCQAIEQTLIWQDTADGHVAGEWKEPEPDAIICDHDAEGRAQFERHFGSTVAAKKDVVDGIQAVQARIKLAQDGRPRLFIVRDCVVRRDPELQDARRPTCTQEELPGYVWSDKKQDTPVKQDDHGMDGLRYMVANRDLVGRPSVRVILP